MNSKKLLMISLLGISCSSFAAGITESTLPFGKKLTTEGSVLISQDIQGQSGHNITKSFYGADTHGFSVLPEANVVTPLQLGFVKFGGSLHSTFNWELNAYADNGVDYVYAPLERRLKYVQTAYKAAPLFQVNMLGWQPDVDANGKLVYAPTANAQHAADAITFLNGKNKVGLEHIIMGNEPFESMEVHGKAIPSADEYIAKYIQYALALRASQEKLTGNSNDIKLWGPEIATGWTGWQTTHPDDCDSEMKCSYGEGKFSEFMPYFLSRLADFEKDSVNNPKHYKMIDYVTFHYYPLFRKNFHDNGSIIQNNDGEQNVAGMLESVNLWDTESYINKYDYGSPRGIAPKLIKKFQGWMTKFYPNAKLAVTEFGIDSVANIDYHPIVRPLYLADLMARMGAAGVDTFIQSFLQGGDAGNNWALINGTEKTHLYNIYSLYSNFFRGTVLKSTDNFGDLVNVYSVKNATGTNVFLVNKDTKVHTSSLNFQNGDNVNEVTNLSLPAWSVTVLTIPENQVQSIKVRQYGAKEMGISVE